jgi:CubicO group peptidase (beta-lactamase class C family)
MKSVRAFVNMKNQLLSRISFAIVIALFSSCASIPKLPDKVESISEFEEYMNKLAESGTPPGMSLVVVKNDSIVYAKGFGWADEPRKIRATPNTVYHWWSCTKIATAIAILQLQEMGKLSLNDPVIRYLPFFQVTYPSDTSKQVTILNLLNHTSGLPDPSAFTFVRWVHHDEDPPVNQTDFIKKVLPDYSKLKFEPGDHSEYSNIGYMVLGAIIEKVTGMAYEDYIRRNILQPLGMNHTDFLYMKKTESEEAAGSHPTFNLMAPLLYIMAPSYVRETHWSHLWMRRVYTDQTPSTGLIGPATDAARLVAAYLNGGVLNSRRILSQESIATMTYGGQIGSKNEDSLNYRRQGIGWQIYGKSGRWVLTHDGGGPGFSTKIQLYPDEHLGFVLFTNDVTCEPWKIINLAATLKW